MPHSFGRPKGRPKYRDETHRPRRRLRRLPHQRIIRARDLGEARRDTPHRGTAADARRNHSPSCTASPRDELTGIFNRRFLLAEAGRLARDIHALRWTAGEKTFGITVTTGTATSEAFPRPAISQS
jgi:hypothetical protein